MIDRMDREIGRFIKQLKQMRQFENTLIFFASDNGASAEIMVRNGGHDPTAEPGSAATYLCLGPGFSSAANTPFRRHKTWVHEGGISTPLIVHWPRGIRDRGELRRTPGHMIDIVPTIYDAIGIQKPATWEGEAIPAAPGHSLLPAFERDMVIERDSLWWLHEGNRAIRIGDWKLVAAKGDPWELYNLETDRAEANNLAAMRPNKAKQLEEAWQRQLKSFSKLAAKTVPVKKRRGLRKNKKQSSR
jgi:arylsulfatase